MNLAQATIIAERYRDQLAPHCERIEIAGSIRRGKPEVKDIELVAIPKPYEVGLFQSGIATVLDALPKVRGELPCRYTQRMLPEGIALDFFTATPATWGLIYAMRTGSADYSHYVLAAGWVRRGFKSIGGQIHDAAGRPVATPEEEDLFALCGVPFTEPAARNMTMRKHA